MRIPQIQISQGYAKIDLRIQKPKVEIEQKRAYVSITQKPAQLKVERINGSIDVDTTEARANMDLKSVKRRIEEFADLARQDLLEGISSRGADGDRMASIQNKADSIGSMAMDKMLETSETYAPPYNPNYMTINIAPDKLNIDWTINKPEITISPNKPTINHIWGNVETYVKQKNWLKIDVPSIELHL